MEVELVETGFNIRKRRCCNLQNKFLCHNQVFMHQIANNRQGVFHLDEAGKSAKQNVNSVSTTPK